MSHSLFMALLCTSVLISSSASANVEWEPVKIEPAPAAPPLENGLPDQVLRISKHEHPFSIHNIKPGIARTEAQKQLQATHITLKLHQKQTLTERWLADEELQGRSLKYSYQLHAHVDAPDHISAIEASWFSMTIPASTLFDKLLRTLTQRYGTPMDWQQASSHYRRYLLQQQSKIKQQLAQLIDRTRLNPTLGALVNGQKRKLHMLDHTLQTLSSTQVFPVNDLCSSFDLKDRYCHLRGDAHRSEEGYLSTGSNNQCRIWLKENGDMLSACQITGGATLRLTSPAADRLLTRMEQQRAARIPLKL